MAQKKVLPILFATLLLDMIGTGMIIPILPIIFTDPSSPAFLLHGFSTGAQYFIAGLITALFGLMQFIGAPILGEFSDVYGRKRLLNIGVVTLAVAQLIFGFGIEIKALWLLLLSRAIAGLAGANFSIAQAAIADVTEPKDRAKNFGLIGAAFGIGFILGPFLGGWIANFAGNPAAPFWFAGILGALNALSVALFLPETHHNRKAEHNFHFLKGIQNIQAAFRDKDARPIYTANFFYFSGFAFFTSFLGVYLVNRFHLDEASIGTFFGVVGVWVVITQLFILRFLAKHYHERQILRFSILVQAASILLYPFLPHIAWLYFLVPFVSIPQGLSMANLSALVSKSVSAERQGAALGINGSLLAFAQGIIPLIAGAGSGSFGLTLPFFASTFLIGSAWAILFLRK